MNSTLMSMPQDFQHPKNEYLLWGRATRNNIKKWQRYTIFFLVFALFSSLAIIGLVIKDSRSTNPEFQKSTNAGTNPSETMFPVATQVCIKWNNLIEEAKKKPLTLEEMNSYMNEISEVAKKSKSKSLRELTQNMLRAIEESNVEEFKNLTPKLGRICETIKAGQSQ